MRSMYSGVSGLRTHQTKMDVIGNNIANVNTTAFKSQRVTFNEVFSQTLQSASSANADTGRGGLNPMQVGLGVNVSSIDMLMTQGAAQRTDNPFDLMIDGDGFMVVGDASGQYFTRAGALRKDDDGNLIIPNGMKVMGWQADKEGKKIVRSNVSPIVLDSPQNKFASPQLTSKVEITGNLKIADALKPNPDYDPKDPTKEPSHIPDLEGIAVQIKMYDSLGNLHSMNMKAVYNTTDEEWALSPVYTDEATKTTEITDEHGNSHIIPWKADPADVKFKFDTNGKLHKDSATGFKIIGDQTGDFFEINGANLGPITVDFSSLTQYNAKTNIDPKTLDGRAPGEMQGYDIGPDGIITAYYNNGEFKLLGQVVVTNFDNPAGLEKVGDNIYRNTANSGDFDGIGTAGIFQAGVLEMSNVDLSQEFTEMITTQRGFQANSKIISTSDEMLHELVNLKR